MKFSKTMNFIMVGVTTIYAFIAAPTLVWFWRFIFAGAAYGLEAEQIVEYFPDTLSLLVGLCFFLGFVLFILGVVTLIATSSLPKKSKGRGLAMTASILTLTGCLIGWFGIVITIYHIAVIALFLFAGLQVGKQQDGYVKNPLDEYVPPRYTVTPGQGENADQISSEAHVQPTVIPQEVPLQSAATVQPTVTPQEVPLQSAATVQPTVTPQEVPMQSAATVQPTVAPQEEPTVVLDGGVLPDVLETIPTASAQPDEAAGNTVLGQDNSQKVDEQ